MDGIKSSFVTPPARPDRDATTIPKLFNRSNAIEPSKISMSSEEYELRDPTLDEYDPAKRRKWAYDPKRSKTHRTGKEPPGLRRWRLAHKKRDPARHYGKKGRKHDPARRMGGIFRKGRRRRHDPGFGPAGSWQRSGTDYLGVALGSILHNFIVHTKGFLSGTFNAGPVNMTQLGAAAGLIGIVGEHQRMIEPNGFLSDVLKGIFAEGFNVPAVESIQRQGGAGSRNLIADGSGGGLMGGGSFPSGATQSPLGIGPAGYIPVWAYT